MPGFSNFTRKHTTEIFKEKLINPLTYFTISKDYEKSRSDLTREIHWDNF